MVDKDLKLVNHGQTLVMTSPGKLGCLSLQSCLALIAYDPVDLIGGITRISVPHGATVDDAQYMDRALVNLTLSMSAQGAHLHRLRFAAVGGSTYSDPCLDVMESGLDKGHMNVKALIYHLGKRGIRLVGQRLGGVNVLSTQICLSTGEVFVASLGRELELLCNLKEGDLARTAA